MHLKWRIHRDISWLLLLLLLLLNGHLREDGDCEELWRGKLRIKKWDARGRRLRLPLLPRLYRERWRRQDASRKGVQEQENVAFEVVP